MRYVVCIDPGLSYVKGSVLQKQGDKIERLKRLQFSSEVEEINKDNILFRDGVDFVEVDGKSYVLSIPGRDISSSSPLVKADKILPFTSLFLSELKLSGEDNPVAVFTCFPPSHFKKSLQAVEGIKGRHDVARGDVKFTYDIVSISAIPEGISSFFDFVLDEQGNYRPGLLEKTVLIFDIGSKTTDYALVRNGIKEGSGSIADGTEKILDAIFEYVEVESPLATEETAKKVRRVIFDAFVNRQPTVEILIRGRELILDEAVMEEAITGVFEKLSVRMEQIINKTDPEFVIFVGGGAELFRHLLEEKFKGKGFVIPEEPAWSSVRGLEKASMLMLK